MKRVVTLLVGLAAASAPIASLAGAATASASGATVHKDATTVHKNTVQKSAGTVQKTASEIAAEAESATLSATSITLTERVVVDGTLLRTRIEGRYPNRVELAYSVQGILLDIDTSPSTIYLRSDLEGWESIFKLSAASSTALAGRWFETSSANPAIRSEFAELNPKTLERALFKEFQGAVPDLSVRLASVGGKPSYELADSGGAMYVLATGIPYIERITALLGADHGFMQFSGYDASTAFALPKAAANLEAAIAAAGSPTSTTTASATPVTPVTSATSTTSTTSVTVTSTTAAG